MIPMSMPLKQLWNQLTKPSGKMLAGFWWSSYCSHLRAQPDPISHHRHPRDPPSQDHLLASRPSMSSGILWLLSSWSEVVAVLMTTHSSAVQLTKHTYWRLISQPYVSFPISIDPSLNPYVRPITPPSDIATRTTSSDTGTSTSIRTNYSSTDSLSFLLRRRYQSLSNKTRWLPCTDADLNGSSYSGSRNSAGIT